MKHHDMAMQLNRHLTQAKYTDAVPRLAAIIVKDALKQIEPGKWNEFRQIIANMAEMDE